MEESRVPKKGNGRDYNMIKVKIYVLKDPRNDKIRYVGKTIRKLDDRLYYHICQQGKSHKHNWIKQLLDLKLRPIIELLDEVDANEWEYWEQFWISVFKFAGFDLTNQTDGGEGTHGLIRTKEHTEKITSSLKKKVKCFNTKGVLLNIYDSIKEASEKTGVQKSHISTCMNGKLNTCKGLIFRSYNDSFYKYSIRNKKTKQIIQSDKEGKFIKKWNSIAEAAKALDTKPQNISRVLNGSRKKHRGFQWSYYN